MIVNICCTVNLQAVLGASAVDNETNIVSVETKDFYMQNVKQPIMSLTSGVASSVNFVFPCRITAICGVLFYSYWRFLLQR